MKFNPLLLIVLLMLVGILVMRLGGIRGLRARLGRRRSPTAPVRTVSLKRPALLPAPDEQLLPPGRRARSAASQLAPTRRINPSLRRLSPRRAAEQAAALWQSRGRQGQIIIVGIVVLLLVLLSRFVAPVSPVASGEHLAVAISPFLSPSGELQDTGVAVAEELYNKLRTDPEYQLKQEVSLTLLRQPIRSLEEASKLADDSLFDVVIWGQAEPGAIANSRDLRPSLLFIPRRSNPVDRWPMVRERLVMPASHALSMGEPINGLAVLSPLLDALELYLQGRDIDQTVALLTGLLDGYQGVLSPSLPATLRGSIRWVQGDLTGAELDMRRVIEAAPGDPGAWNNLGAVLQDREDSRAEEAFDTSLRLAQEQGGDLAAVHINRALPRLGDQDPAFALGELRRAAELRPNQPAIMVPLSRMQRRAGDLKGARETMNGALALAPGDPAVMLEAGRLRLAEMLGASGPLEWALEEANSLSVERLTPVREQLSAAANAYETQVAAHRQAATRNDTLGKVESGRLYEALASRLEQELNEARYWQGVAQIEEGRAAARVDESFLTSLWDTLRGEVSPLELGRQTLSTLHDRTASYETRYQLGRAWKLQGIRNRAEEQFLAASAQDPGRPEAFYGRASLLWDDRQSEERDNQLRELLGQALAANERYYPARRMLVRLELGAQRWAEALVHLDWMVTDRPNDAAAAVARGQALRQLQRYPEAEQQLINLANEGNTAAMIELALVYRDTFNEQPAREVLQRVLDQDPRNARAAYELGVLLHNQGKEQEAAEKLELAASARPGYLEAHLLLGEIYNGPLQQPSKAIAHYQRAIDSGGSDPRNYEVLGGLFLKAGVPQEAARALQRAIQLNPDAPPEVHHNLASAYLQLGQYEQARASERTAIERSPEQRYPEALAGVGDSYRFEQRYGEAIQAYSQALEQDPNLVKAYIGLGRMAADQDQLQVAIGHYLQALERDPNNADAHYWLGMAYLKGGSNESALGEFQAARELNSNLVDAWYGNALASLAMGERAAAKEQLKEVLRQRPGHADALLARGKLYEEEGNITAAVADYNAAAQANPRLAEPLYLIGLIQMGRNDFASATTALEGAVQRQDNFAEAHYWLGRAYRAQSRNQAAVERFQRAAELRPDLLEARYFLASSYAELGRRDEAIVAYEEVIALSPADSTLRSQAQEALDRLR